MSVIMGPNVLVLGVGGNVGQGIIKSLRLSPVQPRIFGGCIDPLSAGLYLADYGCITPPASSQRFFKWLVAFCKAHQIQGVFSGVDAVLKVLAEKRSHLQQLTGTVAVVSEPVVLRLACDKLATSAWLREQGLPSPRTAAMNDYVAVRQLREECGYPLVVKPRRGRGGIGFAIARSDEELRQPRCDYTPTDLLVQEYLADRREEEYTATSFVDATGAVRATIAFHRKLLGGATIQAIAGDFAEVRQAAAAIVGRLRGVMGPCNVQLRWRGDELVCFDINLRYSSTCPMRARMGFNDVDAALQHFVLDETVPRLNETPTGVALRYWNEVYVDCELPSRLLSNGELDLANIEMRAAEILVEDLCIRRCERNTPDPRT